MVEYFKEVDAMEQEKIGKFIKELRLKNNMTQKEFAEVLNVTYQAVSKWENGKNIPDIQILKEISDKFKVDINEILDGSIKKKKKLNYKIACIISVLLILITPLTIYFFKMRNNIEIKPITSACEDFNINGVAVYDRKMSILYISNVEYCKDEDNTIYKNISCTLFENYKNEKIEISSCDNEQDMTLQDFLNKLSFKVENFTTSCEKLENAKLFLEIKADINTTLEMDYKIPLKISPECN